MFSTKGIAAGEEKLKVILVQPTPKKHKYGKKLPWFS